MESPRSLKRQLDTQLQTVEDRLETCRKKLKLEKEKTKRLKKRVSSLTEIINELKQKMLISTGCAEMLENSFSGVSKELLTRVEQGKKSKVSEELRSFAMTLHFYSAKAYAYVREIFDLVLPHPDTIRTWYSNISADPGFTKPAFSAIETHVKDRKKDGKETLCALMMDEIAIRKHVEYAAGKFHGYVDLGCGTVDDSLPPAKDALVLMVVAINESWKIPVAYFLIDGLTGEERANIINECLQRLHGIGVRTVSLTCDGPSCHFAMLRALGAKLDVHDMRSSFPHPADPSQVVHVVLDVCHMLKLLRNALAEGGTLQTPTGKISWQYLQDLNKLQETEGLRLGNKLKMANIRWEKQKMKVKLAAQVFSSSVADALEYCNTQLHLPQFRGCEETVEFLRTIDAAFDVLNSRNPLGKGCKAPMRTSNKDRVEQILLKAQESLLELKNDKGIPMHSGKRKTCVVGFIANCVSVWNIFQEVVCKPNAPCRYFLTYKLSQDHLELFFSSIRACGGFNNNPTARQFTAAYKRLLVKLQVKTGTGNCILRDDTSIMEATPASANTSRRFDLEPVEHAEVDHDYQLCPNVDAVSEYKDAAINYIAGFVVKKIK
ncbi:DNA transposase THAP9 [Centroberyx affinis]|uniref:DNA transposase THAP9 n=1 Tax=Centroberyx affinis TaxID=166261 RepID=UPI003A5C27D0